MRILVRLAAAALVVAASAAAGQAPKAGAVSVTKAWARATPPGASTGAVFMTLSTAGGPDRLVRVDSAAAEKAELHTMSMDGGVMRMRPVAAIEVKPGAVTELRPGGLHVMLIGLNKPLQEGARVKVTLTFEKAGTLEVSVPVGGLGASGPAGRHMH